MDKTTYIGGLPEELQQMTLNYKYEAEKRERSVGFLLEIHEAFFLDWETKERDDLMLIERINRLFREYKVKAKFTVNEEELIDHMYDPYIEYSFVLTYYKNEYYSDDLLKEMLVILFDSDILPPARHEGETIWERKSGAIYNINTYARQTGSPIRVVGSNSHDTIEVVTIV